MATAVAASSSHNAHYRPAVCSSSSRSSPVVSVSPLSSNRRVRVRVNPSPACVARPEHAADKAVAYRRGHSRRAHDEKPRRTTTSPPPPAMRRRRRDAYDASPDRKRRRRGSDARADYYRRPDEARRRGRGGGDDDDDGHRAAADKSKESEAERDPAREDDDRRTRRSSSRSSSKERRAPRAYPSPAARHRHRRHHRPAAESIARPRALAVDEGRKRSPEKEVDQAEDADVRRRRDELQRKREEARRELDKVVRTVWFNDPYISPTCVLNTMPRWSWTEVEEGEVV